MPATITIEALADATEGGAGGAFRVTRDGPTTNPLTLLVTATGTATAGTDYTNLPAYPSYRTIPAGESHVDIAIDAVDDGTAEASETVVVSVAEYTMMGPGPWASDTLLILDNETPVVSVAKVADAAEGGTDGVFRFTRLGDLSSAPTVNFTVGGTATSGTDYAPIGTSVTFAADEATVDVTVSAIDDVAYDPSETVAVTVTSGTGYTFGSPSSASMTITDDEGAPVYWVGGSGGSWSTPSNWSTSSVPSSTTAVYFDSSYSSYGVTVPDTVTQLGELHFVNGYSGTVTLSNNLSVGKLEMASGTLDQPAPGGGISGTDLTVTAAMLWTGGTINSTTNLSTVTVTGSATTALIAPVGGGTVSLGSNFEVLNGAVATQSEGTISVADGVRILVQALGKWAVDPGATKVATVNVNINPAVVKQIDIGPGGVLQVLSGRFETMLAIKNAGGSVVLDSKTYVRSSGTVAGAGPFTPFVQTAGATYIAVDAEFDLGGLGLAEMSGGVLSIKCGLPPAGWTGHHFSGGELRLSGATVEFDPAGGARSEFGTLKVDGNVEWTAGTYQHYVDAAGLNSDGWQVTGTLTIGGTATVAVTAIDSSDGDRVVVPPKNTKWSLFLADTITEAAGTPSITAKWAIKKDAEQPDKIWRAEYTG